MKISVIVPVFNTNKYLKESLESIRKQTFTNIEIILVDDGSFDGSQEICDEFARYDSRFKVFHIQNKGYSFARNYGIAVAKGEYVTFVDSDDICESTLFENQINSLIYNNADISVCREKLLYRDTSIEYNIEDENCVITDLDEKNHLIFSLDKFRRSPFAGGQCWKKMMKRSLLKDIKFIDDREMCEDEIFTKKVFDKATRIVLNGKSAYFYRMRRSSAINSNNFNLKIIKGRIKLYNEGKIGKKILVESCIGFIPEIFKIPYEQISCEQFSMLDDIKRYSINVFSKLSFRKKILVLFFILTYSNEKNRWGIVRYFMLQIIKIWCIKMNKKKVAILIFRWADNYGAVLQCYLYQVL